MASGTQIAYTISERKMAGTLLLVISRQPVLNRAWLAPFPDPANVNHPVNRPQPQSMLRSGGGISRHRCRHAGTELPSVESLAGQRACDRFQETARARQVAPIGNRLCRRLAAGWATEVACQYGILPKHPGQKLLEEFCLKSSAGGVL